MENKLQPQLTIEKGRVLASSLDVARCFNKRHNNVIRAIKNLEIPNDFRLLNFEQTSFEVKQPNGGYRKTLAYNMTRDGFTILVMGFTGKEAMQWKIRYIEAFNKMEAYLKGGAKGQMPLFTSLPQAEPLTSAQRKSLDFYVHAWAACSPMGAPNAWQRLHKHFGTKSIRDFKASQLPSIIQWLQERIQIAVSTGGLSLLDMNIFEPYNLIVQSRHI